MSGLVYDTLAVSRRLQQGGFTLEQAEALATEQARLVNDQLATKADIAGIDLQIEALRADVRRIDLRIESVRADLVREIETLRAEILRELSRSHEMTSNRMDSLRRELTIRLTVNMGLIGAGLLGAFQLLRVLKLISP